MPLRQGKGKSVLAANIKELIESGRPQDQAVAIAYAVSRRGKKQPASKKGK